MPPDFITLLGGVILMTWRTGPAAQLRSGASGRTQYRARQRATHALHAHSRTFDCAIAAFVGKAYLYAKDEKKRANRIICTHARSISLKPKRQNRIHETKTA